MLIAREWPASIEPDAALAYGFHGVFCWFPRFDRKLFVLGYADDLPKERCR